VKRLLAGLSVVAVLVPAIAKADDSPMPTPGHQMYCDAMVYDPVTGTSRRLCPGPSPASEPTETPVPTPEPESEVLAAQTEGPQAVPVPVTGGA